MNIGRVLVSTLCVAIGLVVRASPPPPIEPFEQAFARLSASYPAMCEQLSREVQLRLTPEAQQDAKETLAVLDRCVQNIRGDDIHGIQRIINGQSKDALGVWCARLVGDMVDFRRTLDRLVIENMARSRLKVDAALLKSLQTFWDQERHFSWRFELEVKGQAEHVRS